MMPLPVIAAAWVLGSLAAGGAGAGGSGALKMRRAKNYVLESQERLEFAEATTAEKRDACDGAFVELGAEKVTAIQEGLLPFQQAFSRLKNVRFNPDLNVEGAPPIDEIKAGEVASLALSTADALGIASIGGAAAASATGVATGAATATLGVAGATASTGTAIGSLSGIAAQNATLAWLGGGALSAGGGGVAVGTAMLSGMAAAPAVLVGGVLVHKKGREALANAEEYSGEVRSAVAKHKESQVILGAATEIANGLRGVLRQATPRLAGRSGWLASVAEREADFTKLTTEEQDRIQVTATLAKLVSDVVHTPIVDEGGAVTEAVQRVYRRGQAFSLD